MVGNRSKISAYGNFSFTPPYFLTPDWLLSKGLHICVLGGVFFENEKVLRSHILQIVQALCEHVLNDFFGTKDKKYHS